IFSKYKYNIMKAGLSFLFLIFLLPANTVQAQSFSVDKVQFFSDTSALDATITTNLSKMLGRKKEGEQFGGIFTTSLKSGITTNSPVVLTFRGHSRKALCYMPPLEI